MTRNCLWSVMFTNPVGKKYFFWCLCCIIANNTVTSPYGHSTEVLRLFIARTSSLCLGSSWPPKGGSCACVMHWRYGKILSPYKEKYSRLSSFARAAVISGCNATKCSFNQERFNKPMSFSLAETGP